MTVLMTREIDRLKEMMFQLTAKVETNVRKAVESIDGRDLELAREVIKSDIEIDKCEIELEEACLKILALYQPVAIDLRYVIACLKTNNDLERIGDLAVNIAKRTMAICNIPREVIPLQFDEMTGEVQQMLRKCLDSLINMDAELAREVCMADDGVDDLNRKMHKKINKMIHKKPKKCEYYIHLLTVSRNLERIADYATNIAEDVIYMIDGKIVRHMSEMEELGFPQIDDDVDDDMDDMDDGD